MKEMWVPLLFAALLISWIVGCTSIDASITPDGQKSLKVNRFMTDASVDATFPDGTSISYSSDAEAAGLSNINQQLLDAALRP